jgi:L-ascorbate metabolism protein UlaG (beta-lactamase superfamily)
MSAAVGSPQDKAKCMIDLRTKRFIASICSCGIVLLTSLHTDAANFKFENVYPFPQKSFWTAMKWRWSREPAQWPESRPLKADISSKPKDSSLEPTVTWIGHSSFLLQADNKNILFDPVYSDTVGPVSWLSPKRVVPPGLTLGHTPKIDAIFLSHDHFDHMDLPTLEYFALRDNPTVIAGLGSGEILQDAGFSKIVELNWWDEKELGDDFKTTFVPAQHWSTRSLLVRNERLWGGFYIVLGEKVYYFVSDTGYHPELFKEIKNKVGSPDYSFIPVGAYAPREFMKDQHVDPAEALKIHLDVGSKKSVGMHWGTFQLSDEGIDAPCETLLAEITNVDLNVQFDCMEHGESRHIFKQAQPN